MFYNTRKHLPGGYQNSLYFLEHLLLPEEVIKQVGQISSACIVEYNFTVPRGARSICLTILLKTGSVECKLRCKLKNLCYRMIQLFVYREEKSPCWSVSTNIPLPETTQSLILETKYDQEWLWSFIYSRAWNWPITKNKEGKDWHITLVKLYCTNTDYYTVGTALLYKKICNIFMLQILW